MKNKLIIISFLALIASCSSNKKDDPLIIPPNFNDMPDLNKKDQTEEKIPKKDLDELRDLLLKDE